MPVQFTDMGGGVGAGALAGWNKRGKQPYEAAVAAFGSGVGQLLTAAGGAKKEDGCIVINRRTDKEVQDNGSLLSQLLNWLFGNGSAAYSPPTREGVSAHEGLHAEGSADAVA